MAGTRQSLPPDGVQLLDVVRNLPGRAVRIVMREILDAQLPDWHSDAATTVVKHFCYSEQNLKTFYVYPPNTGTGTVELVYSAAPQDAKYPPTPPAPMRITPRSPTHWAANTKSKTPHRPTPWQRATPTVVNKLKESSWQAIYQMN